MIDLHAELNKLKMHQQNISMQIKNSEQQLQQLAVGFQRINGAIDQVNHLIQEEKKESEKTEQKNAIDPKQVSQNDKK